MRLKYLKLELGSRQTLARQDSTGKWVLNDPPPNKAVELLKCQRYFVQFSGIAYAYFNGWNRSVVIDFPVGVTMRANPSASISVIEVTYNNDFHYVNITTKDIRSSPGNIIVTSSYTPTETVPTNIIFSSTVNFDQTISFSADL